MVEKSFRQCIAFSGTRCIARGDLAQVEVQARKALDRTSHPQILIFDDLTSELIDVDLQTKGTAGEASARAVHAARRGTAAAAAPPERPRGPGRPKLGVVAREVTLLPRHWDWLNRQPGGASVALRKLVEEARRVNSGKDRIRQAQESAYRFISAMAGDEVGFEEATRALFARNRSGFKAMTAGWPKDVKMHAARLADASFAEPSGA
jgi:hypothetical protein